MTWQVLFLHGLFGRPRLLDPWIRRLTTAGFECHTVTLPGREPTDEKTLRNSGVDEFFAAVLTARERLSVPPILIGHSFGGLLAQKLAARTETAALVLLASVPPGILWPQLRALPHLFPLLPKLTAGAPILPSPRTFRAVPFSTLPADEQTELTARMVPESGRVFRAMTLGTPAMRVARSAVSCPVLSVSGGADRNVSNAASRRIARRYGAEHRVVTHAPHWIVAESLADEIVPPVIDWLRNTVPDPSTRPTTEQSS
ncbi:MAG: alpha/beta hydrolase [Rhodococcus sp.]|nr:alpha/beta hydrolase [Rhodococcus sp. (in: high G+C Gram-positive bacteria)]